MSYKYKRICIVQLKFSHKQIGWGIISVAWPLPSQDNTYTEETQRDIHASSAIRFHGPSLEWAKTFLALDCAASVIGLIQFKNTKCIWIEIRYKNIYS
jgi:hypothetical protein